MVGAERGKVTVISRFALMQAAVPDAVESLDLPIEHEKNIKLAFAAVVCPLIRVFAIVSLVHGGTTTATQVKGITLWTIFVCASYPCVVRFTAVLASVHLTKLLQQLQSAKIFNNIKSHFSDNFS